MTLNQNDTLDILSKFPDIEALDMDELQDPSFDFFLSALGFEERTLAIPKLFSQKKEINFKEVLYFQYETSTSDNAYNEPKLLQYFKLMSAKVSKLFCDESGFVQLLEDGIAKRIIEKQGPVTVIFDLSVCSSKLILNVIKVLFSLDIKLTIVYTEADVYYPLYSDYIVDPTAFKEKNAVTNEVVVLNSDHPGANKSHPDLIIAFPNFKPQRAKNLISDIDETILIKPDDRLFWIVGDPNMQTIKAKERKEMMLYLNEIPSTAKIYEVSTLNYKANLSQLEQIFIAHHLVYHINIADLGSKMQTLAIGLYCHIRPEISVYNTLPKTYGPSKYSKGIKSYWKVDFGFTKRILELINSIDLINLF